MARIAFWLIAALIGEFLGLFIGRQLGLSQFAAVGVGLVPALLLLFPVIKRWGGERLSFGLWLLVVAGILIGGMLVHVAVG